MRPQKYLDPSCSITFTYGKPLGKILNLHILPIIC